MARFSAFLAVFAGLIAFSAGTPTKVEQRAPAISLPPILSITEIISALTSFGIIKDINVFITPQTLEDNTVSLNFDVQNLLPLEYTIDQLGTDAGLDGTVFATFSHTFTTPLVVPALGTVNSGNIDGVTLPQGALATLGIIPFGKLDLTDLSGTIRELTINGIGGVPLPLSGLFDTFETGVPTSYTPSPANISTTLSLGIIKSINVIVSSFTADTVSLNFNAQNLLPLIEFTIDEISANAGLNGTTFLNFSHSFPSPGLVVPGLGTVNSGIIDGVTLPQGALATFGIIPSQKLDLTGLSTSIRALTISGSGGIPIPLSGLTQSSVPTAYSGSALSGFPLFNRRQILPPSPGQITDLITDLGLFQDFTVTFQLTSILTNKASISFDISNPTPVQITVNQIAGSAGLNGTVFATFSHTFDSGLVIPALGSVNSGTIDGATLPQGVLPFLGIVSAGVLDLTGVSADLTALILILPIPIPLVGLTQTNVPTTYNLGGL